MKKIAYRRSKMADHMSQMSILERCRRTFRWKYWVPWFVVTAQTCILMILVADNPSSFFSYSNDKGGCTQRTQNGGCNSMSRCSTKFDNPPLSFYNVTTKADVPVRVWRGATHLFYNRVPKCGSSSLIDILSVLGSRNNFTFQRAPEYMRYWLDVKWQNNFVRRFMSIPAPMAYERHFHFLDFSSFNHQQPIYINVIRDPIDRLVSWYYFRRYQDGHVRNMDTADRIRTYDQCVLGNHSECVVSAGFHPEEGYFKIIPFFCGQDPICREPGEQALVRAIYNVKRYYAVVGVMEEYDQFIKVLEYVVPEYFKGAYSLYENTKRTLQEKHSTTYKLPVSPEVIQIMRQKLKHEYQFYHFIRKRFHRQMEYVDQKRYSMT